MSSALTAILDAMDTELTTLAPTLQRFRGRAALKAHVATPRVVFVRTRDFPEAPVRLAGGERSVLTLRASVEAHIVATDDDTETHQHAVLVAAHRVAVAHFECGPASWTLPDNTTVGELCVQELRFLVPVLEVAPTTAQVQATTTETGEGTPGDGVMEPDEE